MSQEHWADRQMTREQAIAFHDSKVWESWTPEQIVRLQLFQRLPCIPHSVFHKAIGDVLGRPVYSHEFEFPERLVLEYLGDKPAPTLSEILSLIPANKQVQIFVP